MSIHKTYAVLGLGRYGRAVAEELIKSGAEVLAVDEDMEVVASLSAVFPMCKCADIADADAVEQLGIADIDTVIIAMSNSLEATVMAITLCKEAGVKEIIVKCSTEMHRKIFLRVGADRVILPEKESGIRLARNLISSGFAEMMELSDEISMIELDVRDEWAGKSLVELNLRKKYSINVVAVKKGDSVDTEIEPTAPLEKGAKLIVIANIQKLKKLK
ncbi:MAG: TrkA family potassium uptake protein [Clostridia bacterium]|nr:TrkA family potassium uptake protein [Clostridia bacterium]